MKYSIILLPVLLFCCTVFAQHHDMLIRISEIEIDSNYLQQYKRILKEESRASVELEPGVIAIYPMYQKDHPAQVRILEIYKNREAYESHIKSPHFKKYKSTTSEMVRSLRLVDMDVIDPEAMSLIFRKE